MALKDFEAFIRERVQIWDPNTDVSAGSPFDTEVTQPLLGRIGTDPFSTNLPLFIRERLAQEFPDYARGDGGAIADMLLKPSEILMDPLVREINRIALVQSVADPSLLTTEEAEARMANLFSERKKGSLARGVARVYFSSPRSEEVSPANYCLSKNGLVFPPVTIQSISQDEMLFNTEGSLYYFDVNVEAEAAGDQYNIEPDELVRISGISGVVRVTNKRRFRDGTPAENAMEYISRAEQELSEKSLNTVRGILSALNKNFSEISRVAVVGHGDPEMDRDVITGGGYGPILASGDAAKGWTDGRYGTHTRRVKIEDSGVNFQLLIGPPGSYEGYSLTLYGAFDSGESTIQDIDITSVIDSTILELSSSSVLGHAQNIPWALRKKSITLSDIPGGILFPDGPNGTVEVLDNEVHVGGCTDIYVRSTGFSEGTLVLDAVSDDDPALSGTQAWYGNVTTGYPLVLEDLEFYNSSVSNAATANYFLKEGDETYDLLNKLTAKGYVLQVLSPSHNAGTYRVRKVIQTAENAYDSRHPILLLDRAMTAPTGQANPITWKIQDDVDVELTDPKETKWSGSDLRTYSGQVYVDTASGVDFDSLGIVAGDTLRILNGNDAGDYTLAANPLGAGYTQLQLTTSLTQSSGSVSFIVYRANKAGGLELPLVRVTAVDLMDSSSQLVGSSIPYGKPVLCKTEAFSNAARGTKLEAWDVCVGVVGQVLDSTTLGNLGGKTISIRWYEYWNSSLDQNQKVKDVTFYSVSLSSPQVTLQEAVDQINAALIAEAGVQVSAAHIIDDLRLGISPIGMLTEVWDSDPTDATSAYKQLFGTYTTEYLRWLPPMTSRDVRANSVSNEEVDANTDDEWADAKYDIDREVDGLDILDGTQYGHYSLAPSWHPFFNDYLRENQNIKLTLAEDVNPEADLHVKVGARSIGTPRLYFLEPVTVEFGPESTFTVDDDGVTKIYFPDPSINATKIPAYPSTEELKDVRFSWDAGTSTPPSANTDWGYILSDDVASFAAKGVTTGDYLVVRYEEIFGDEDLAANVANLAGTALVLSVDNGPDLSVVFTETSTSYVSRDAVAEQINEQVGVDIASIEATGVGNVLALSADVSIRVRYKSGASYANSVLGLALTQDKTNRARCEGTYFVYRVESDTMLRCRRLEGSIFWSHGHTGSEPAHGNIYQHASVVSPGTQRFSSTLMNGNEGPAGLYYVDIELASKGVGDEYNIDAGLVMEAENFQTYGYTMSAENNELTYSMLEVPYIHLPPVFFPVGTSDDVQDAVSVVGQNLQITYDTTSVIDSVQDFVNNELDRVTCSNMLIRHLLPHFVLLDLSYTGGSKASYVEEDLTTFITNRFPDQALQADDINSIVKNRGASSVTNPIDVMAVVHAEDRDIRLDWSQNSINTGRLAAFFADTITVTRQ